MTRLEPAENRTDPHVLRGRLGTYLLGLAIGCTLVGMLLYGRYQAAKREQARAEAARAAESAAGRDPQSAGTNNPRTGHP